MNQRRRNPFADWFTFISVAVFSVTAYSQPTVTELPLSLPDNVYVRDMQFINQTTGWLVGAAPRSGLSVVQQRIYGTTDVGQTWTSQLPIEQYGHFWSVYALDANHVFAGGNISYVTFDGRATSDGGNTWLGGSGPPRPSAFSETLLLDVHATSPNKIWAVAGQNILFSNDGVSYSVISSLAGDLWNIEMVSDSTGFVASMNGPNFISKTIDGGNTWFPVFDPGMGIGALDFVSESTGWAVGLDPHDYSSHVYRTVDGGDNWTLLPSRSGGQIDWGQIDFVDELHGWALESYFGRQLWETADGGDSWQLIQTFEDSKWGAQISFSDKDHGWILLGNHVYAYNSDAAVVPLSPAIVFLGSGVGLILASRQRIARSYRVNRSCAN